MLKKEIVEKSMRKRFFDDFLFYFTQKIFLKKFLEQKLVDFSTNFYAEESARIKGLRYFLAFYFICNNFSDTMILEQKKGVICDVETRTITLSVRLTPTDVQQLSDLQDELRNQTGLRVTRGDLISFLIKFYKKERGMQNV